MTTPRRAVRNIEIRSDRVVIVRRGLAGRVATGAMLLLGASVFGLAMFNDTPSTFGSIARLVSGLALYASLAGVPLAGLLAVARRRTPGALRVETERLVLERGTRHRAIALESIEDGWWTRSREGIQAVLRLRSGDRIEARVADAVAAHVMLEALGLDASKHAMRFPLHTTTGELGMGCVTAVVAVCPASILGMVIASAAHATDVAALLVVALIAAAVTVVLAARNPRWISVGADGVTLRRGARTRFLPFAKVQAVQVLGAAIVLKSTPDLEVPVSALDVPTRDALLARLNEAAALSWARTRVATDAGAGIELLDQNGRSFEAWRDALRALSSRDEGYRTRTVSADELMAALQDPSSPVDRRVAAALVLAWSSEADAAARVRVVAEASANERVRVALNTAADGADDPHAVDALLRRAAAWTTRG